MVFKKELRKKWVAALRSGAYPQTKNVLADYRGFCCLGVACKVAEKEGILVEYDKEKRLTGGTLAYQGKVQNALGLKSSAGVFLVKKGEGVYSDSSLVKLNDNGSSFEEIADI